MPSSTPSRVELLKIIWRPFFGTCIVLSVAPLHVLFYTFARLIARLVVVVSYPGRIRAAAAAVRATWSKNGGTEESTHSSSNDTCTPSNSDPLFIPVKLDGRNKARNAGCTTPTSRGWRKVQVDLCKVKGLRQPNCVRSRQYIWLCSHSQTCAGTFLCL
jgi:hypothetical protein